MKPIIIIILISTRQTMSAVEKFKSRVVQSAAAAAIAARQLSSLDEMAENDEYVQSEGLNVVASSRATPRTTSSSGGGSTGSRTTRSGQDEADVDHHHDSDNYDAELTKIVPPLGLESLSDKFVGAISTAARPNNSRSANHVRNNYLATNNTMQASMSTTTSTSTLQYPTLMSSVAALYEQNNKSNNDKSKVRHKMKTEELLSNNESKQHGIHSKQDKTNGESSKAKQINSVPHIVPKSHNMQSRVLLVNEHHAHILHQLDYDSDNDSSDDEQPDLKVGRVDNIALHEHNELEHDLETARNYNNEKAQKDPHRFMKMTANLESEREALLKSLESVSTPSITSRVEHIDSTTAALRMEPMHITGTTTLDNDNIMSRGSAGDRSNEALKAGLSWVRNVASPQLQAFSKQIMSKVAEGDGNRASSTTTHGNHNHSREQRKSGGPLIGPRHSKLSNKKDSSEEEIIMTTSATFLADEDRAELERMQNKHSSSQVLTLFRTGLEVLWHNPRLAFIGATLIFAMLVYYYSKKRSVDDVL